ncbi:hypothetical protein GYB43_06580 [bacterium]|nr:hypothetical protein [bacterium]
MDSEDNYDAHEQFTRHLLESEPVMIRSILVIVPHQDDAREIMQETAVALWRQFDSYDPTRPFINWVMERFRSFWHKRDYPRLTKERSNSVPGYSSSSFAL